MNDKQFIHMHALAGVGSEGKLAGGAPIEFQMPQRALLFPITKLQNTRRQKVKEQQKTNEKRRSIPFLESLERGHYSQTICEKQAKKDIQ